MSENYIVLLSKASISAEEQIAATAEVWEHSPLELLYQVITPYLDREFLSYDKAKEVLKKEFSKPENAKRNCSEDEIGEFCRQIYGEKRGLWIFGKYIADCKKGQAMPMVLDLFDKLPDLVNESRSYVPLSADSNKLVWANLRRAALKKLKFIEAKKSYWADLSGAYLRDAGLDQAILSGANLRGADLSGAELRCADLSNSFLCDADLRGADLIGADLRGVDLRGADLRGAFLAEADLRGADLRGADLRGAFLTDADLREANLSRANLIGAKLDGARLKGTIFEGQRRQYAQYCGYIPGQEKPLYDEAALKTLDALLRKVYLGAKSSSWPAFFSDKTDTSIKHAVGELLESSLWKKATKLKTRLEQLLSAIARCKESISTKDPLLDILYFIGDYAGDPSMVKQLIKETLLVKEAPFKAEPPSAPKPIFEQVAQPRSTLEKSKTDRIIGRISIGVGITLGLFIAFVIAAYVILVMAPVSLIGLMLTAGYSAAKVGIIFGLLALVSAGLIIGGKKFSYDTTHKEVGKKIPTVKISSEVSANIHRGQIFPLANVNEDLNLPVKKKEEEKDTIRAAFSGKK